MENTNKQNSENMWGKVAAGAASVAGGVIGMIGQGRRAKKQHERQKELMDIQQQNQLGLAEDAHNRQMDIWNKTNYEAQMKHIKDAGLNPALLYGQSGAGGATTGAGNMGQAAGGQASAPMDIGAAMNSAMIKSQIDLNKAQAEKLKAEADSTRGGEGTTGAALIEKTKEETKKIIAQTLTEGQKAGLTLQQAMHEAEKIDAQKIANEINEATKQEQITTIGLKVITEQLQQAKTESGTRLNNQQIEELGHRIYQNWIKTGAITIGALGGVISQFVKKGIVKK